MLLRATSSGNSLQPHEIAWGIKFVILYVKCVNKILIRYFINNRFAFTSTKMHNFIL